MALTIVMHPCTTEVWTGATLAGAVGVAVVVDVEDVVSYSFHMINIKAKRRKVEKEKSGKGEKYKRGKGEKGKRGKGEKEKRGKGEK